MLSLILRARRYQRWHSEPEISTRTSFYAAAAIVTRVLARYAFSRFLIELGATLERVNSTRAAEIRSGLLYPQGSVETNTSDFVRYEQGVVQAHLEQLRRSAPRRYSREMWLANRAFDLLHINSLTSFVNPCFVHAAHDAVRLAGPLDFAEQSCREILGRQIALRAAFELHSRSPVTCSADGLRQPQRERTRAGDSIGCCSVSVRPEAGRVSRGVRPAAPPRSTCRRVVCSN
jgi:hypothetical protein